MKIDVEAEGLDRVRLWLRRLSKNAKNLYPLANKGLERWRESESRTYAARAGWAPRKPDTMRRYRWPIKTLNGVRKGRAKNKGVGFYTGGLQRALTKPHQPGIKDRAHVGRGKLSLEVGIKGGREPRAYGHWFMDRTGQPTIVTFDEKAQRDLAADTRQHLMPEDGDR